MGAAESREGRIESDSDEDEGGSESPVGSENSFQSTLDDGTPEPTRRTRTTPPSSVSSKHENSLDLQMESLSLRSTTAAFTPSNGSKLLPAVKLYQHLGVSGCSGGKWVLAEKQAPWEFLREGHDDDDDEEEEEDDDSDVKWRSATLGKNKDYKDWLLRVGSKVKCRVDDGSGMHFFDEQLRVDFVARGVWAMKFPSQHDYRNFVIEFQNCRFENTYFLEATEANKLKVFGKDFMVWSKVEGEEESIWQDAEDVQEPTPRKAKELRETHREQSKLNNIQSLTMGALDHSFLLTDSGLDVLSNRATGLQSKDVTIRFEDGGGGSGVRGATPFSTPKKGMLIRGESNMMLLSPLKDGKSNAGGVSQLDIGTGKMVAEWKFEKDGTPITMRDVTNDSKGSQLQSGGSTFLGLDDNRLCRWDMRDRHGVVQQLASPVSLSWAEGHQFSRGTNFQCFATAGDGSIVVGSRDGKVRLYGITSMRQAKTVFPGLGSPITHVDVTYDGKWVLATTDSYMILIGTVFKDKDGKTKTGFSGRMGGRIVAPRLLKVNPVDFYGAGKQQKFHEGQFSWVTEEGKQERNLVVSAGNYTVIWNFMRVKDSNHDCYKCLDIRTPECNFFWNPQAPLCNKWEDIKSALGPYRKQYKSAACFIFSLQQTGLKTCYCYKVLEKDSSVVHSKFMHEKYVQSSDEAPLVVATPNYVSSFNMDL